MKRVPTFAVLILASVGFSVSTPQSLLGQQRTAVPVPCRSLDIDQERCRLAFTWIDSAFVALSEDFGAAESAARRAVELAPKLSAAHWTLGYILYSTGWPRSALPSLREAVALKPFFPEAHSLLARILASEERRFGEAFYHAQQAARQEPNQADHWVVLGGLSLIFSVDARRDSHAELERLREFVGYFQRALFEDPSALEDRPVFQEAYSEALARVGPQDPAALDDENIPRVERTLTGSGVVVSTAGYVLTNHHVVSECSRIELRSSAIGTQGVELYATDVPSDLAILRLGRTMHEAVPLRGDPSPPLGEEVTILGYPLSGLLTSDLQLTTGVVSALRGMSDDPRLIQVTAPIQAGSSGGPILDERGNLIAIATAKLDALKVEELTGDLPQNVNFGIRLELISTFLAAYDIPSREPRSARMSPGEIGEHGRNWTVQVICH